MAELKHDHFCDLESNESFEYNSRSSRSSFLYKICKRCFDFIISLIGSIMIFLPLCILCFWSVIEDFGNPFYMQMRVGKNGKDLPLLKLRSMKKDADKLGEMLNEQQLEEYLREYKLRDDPRLLGRDHAGKNGRCFGAFIRKTSLDELPQICWNVLIKGNMSLVGPRPILSDELERFYTPEERKKLLSVQPGITGYWQVYARNNATYETGERQKMELFYVDNRSLKLDIKILFATINAVIRKNGAA